MDADKGLSHSISYTGFHRALEIDQRGHSDSWQIQMCTEIEVDAIDHIRKTSKEKNGRAPSYTALVIKAIALAMDETRVQYPQINSFLQNIFGWKRIIAFDKVSAGCSIALEDEDAVLLGVIQEPQKMELLDLTNALAELSNTEAPWAKNTLKFFQLPGFLQKPLYWLGKVSTRLRYTKRGTFCLNPIGKYGVDYHLSLPQTSSLQFGLGHIRPRVVAREGQPVVAKTFYLTLSFNRRLMNGRPPGILLTRIREILHSPNGLL